MGSQGDGTIDYVRECVELVDPVFKLAIIFLDWRVVRLSRAPGQTICAVRSTRDVEKLEVEGQDSEDPAIDADTGCDVRLLKHLLDKFCVHLDDQVANAQ